MVNWRIYYAGGSTFDSDQGLPQDAPSLGAQIVLVKDGRFNRRVLKLADYYVFRPSLDRWTDHQDATSVMIAALCEPWVKVVAGRYLREADFEQILIRAHDDPDFPAARPDGPAHEAWRS